MDEQEARQSHADKGGHYQRDAAKEEAQQPTSDRRC
jgi:hypothetical protein